MKLVRTFALGLFYLVSGIYSLGLALFMDGLLRPVSGTQAYVMTPDAIFPYEVMLFTIFGGIFLFAALFQFKSSLALVPGSNCHAIDDLDSNQERHATR
jgi:hypothetical protein